MPYYYDWKPYLSVAARRAQAAREAAALSKAGRQISPVVIDGRKIATTFWGRAWCDNLERYSDFATRLPRGRSYVRNGAVIDLQITPGVVKAIVSGSELYETQITVTSVSNTRWRSVCDDCAGAIDSVIELLQGRFSDRVMSRICHEETGLFPSPSEITFRCSCPDWAVMCKHVAAVLYAIGARLDAKPDLLFLLRRVDHQELITQAGSGLPRGRGADRKGRVLVEADLSSMFGIDIAQEAELPPVSLEGAPAGKKKRDKQALKTRGGATAEAAARPAKEPASLSRKRSVVKRRTKGAGGQGRGAGKKR